MNETIVYFLAYLSICDEYIDNREVNFIENYIKRNKLSDKLLDNVFKIYGNETDKITLDDIYKKINNFSYDELLILNKIAYELMYCDGYLDGREESLLLELKMNEKIDKQTIEQIKTKASKNQYKYNNAKNLLSDEINLIEFNQLIDKTKRISREDIKFVKTFFNQNNEVLNILIKDIENLIISVKKAETTNENSIVESLESIKQKIDVIANDRLKNNYEAVVNKERSIKNFTISFLGRTQAGKSTLHSILSNEGLSFIGKGKERTTRYKRAYLWNNLKIIDTPGISAADAKGVLDKDIATSSIDESDIICFVFITPPQLSEFEYLFNQIKEKNKPIIILLNYNFNSFIINYDWENFIKNPYSWTTERDKNNEKSRLDETIDVIKEYFSKKYFKFWDNELISKIIYPVHLLIAKKSLDLKDENSQNELLNASKIRKFTNAISKSIIDEGIIRRSQNFLDGTIQNIRQTREEIENFKNPFALMKSKLHQKNSNLENELKKINSEYKKKLTQTIEHFFYSINTVKFASDYYAASEETINYQWQIFFKNEISKLQKQLEVVFEEYKTSIEQYFKEMSENLNVYFDLMFEVGNINIENSINWRGIFKIFGKIIDWIGTIAIFIPGIGWLVGLAISLVGKLINWIGNWFKSKEKIKSEKIENLNENLLRSKNKQKERFLEEIIPNFESKSSEIIAQAKAVFSKLEDTFTKVENSLVNLILKITTQENTLNHVFAWRIYNFANYINSVNYKIPIQIIPYKVKRDIIKFKRDEKEFEMKTKNIENTDLVELSNKLSYILQEKITLNI